MIKYIQGDIVNSAKQGKIHVFAHQANCFCKGRRGIAPLIFEAFPSVRGADDRTKVGDREKLGNLSHAFSRVGEDNEDMVWGFNLYGQYHFVSSHKEYGTQYDELASALCKMRVTIATRKTLHWPHDKVLKVGFPLIGCGLAGGDWDVVESMINDIFGDEKYIDLYVYTLDRLEGKNYVDCVS